MDKHWAKFKEGETVEYRPTWTHDKVERVTVRLQPNRPFGDYLVERAPGDRSWAPEGSLRALA